MTPDDLRFLRLPETLIKRGVSRSTHLRDVKVGRWPPPVKIGTCAIWPAHEIDALMRAELAGASDDQLHQLTRELVEQRKLPVSVRVRSDVDASAAGAAS